MLRAPDDTQRLTIVGQTGSGKSTFGLWHLSRRSYDKMPWIIIDAKREPMFRDIPRLTEIRADQKPPRRRGLYIVRPGVADFDDGVMTRFLYHVWHNEDTGLMIDEGYAFARMDRGIRTVFTQGRSKHIPIIALSQKPSWVSPFIFSESEYKAIFYLDMPNDIDRVLDWMPPRLPDGEVVDPFNLPAHHCYWRAGPYREFAHLGPCPPEAEIFQTFDERLPRRMFI